MGHTRRLRRRGCWSRRAREAGSGVAVGSEVLDPARPYAPRVALRWLAESPDERHRRVDGSLVFLDISGFTRLSERLAAHGRAGAGGGVGVVGAGVAAPGGGLERWGGGGCNFARGAARG